MPIQFEGGAIRLAPPSLLCPPIDGHGCNSPLRLRVAMNEIGPLPVFGHFHSFKLGRNEAALRRIGNWCKE
jgi:hypothetical protein